MPARLLSKAKSAMEARALFMACYGGVGAVLGFFATFWFFGEVNVNKLLFIQFAAGALAPALLDGARLRLAGAHARAKKSDPVERR